MTEPVYRWEPATDEYKAKDIQVADIEAELKQKIEETNASRLPWKSEAPPLGIRIFTWYYIGPAGVCALVLFILAGFPQSASSTWLTDSIGNFLRLPGSKSDQEAKQKEVEKMAQEYAVPENAISDIEPRTESETLRNLVIGYLIFNLGVAAVVGFMWWNRSWKVRWVTMFYAGALIAKVLINVMARAAAGAGFGIDPANAPMLMLTLGFNGLIFLYLAFGYGVKDWFEPES